MSRNNHKRKSIRAFLLTTIMAATTVATSIPAHAAAENPEDFTFDKTSQGVSITGLTEKGKTNARDGFITIPDSIDNTPVTSLADKAFYDLGIKDITFPDKPLVTIGASALAGNKLVDVEVNAEKVEARALSNNKLEKVILNNTKIIGVDGLRDNNLNTVEFTGDTLVEISDRAFLNNDLSDITLPDSLETLGDNVFGFNKFTEVDIPDSIDSFGKEMFANNKSWVKIHTESDKVTTQEYKGKYGHVVNPVTLRVEYLDDNGKAIQPARTLGDDAEKTMYGKGEEAKISVPKLKGYTFSHYTTQDSDDRNADNPAVITPTEDNYTIKMVYEKGDHSPEITVNGTLNFPSGDSITARDILNKIEAKTWDGETIPKNNIEVFPDSIDASQPGEHKVVITATDSQGNSHRHTETVYVGINWGKLEVGGGWLVEDYTYDGNEVTGYSESGLKKNREGNTTFYAPTRNLEGEVVEGIKDGSWYREGAFYDLGIEKIGSWGSLKNIGNHAFSGSQITELLDSWGDVESIGNGAFYGNQTAEIPGNWGKITKIGTESFLGNRITSLPGSWGEIEELGSGVFHGNRITSLPDSWSGVKTIGGSAFRENQITSLPKSWGKVGSIGDYAFYENQITDIPDNWGNITKIEGGVFRSNRVTSLPKSWGDVESIGSYAFHYNQITSLPKSWGKVGSVGWSAFQENQITEIPSSWDDVEFISKYAFRNNQITSIPGSWGGITEINDNVFYGNQITELPDSWGDVESIGGGAFLGNQITSLPKSWGDVESVGGGAFRNNQITSIPGSWGGITEINDNVFYGNQITELPDSWGDVESIGRFAFFYNPTSEIPSDWSGIKEISSPIFYNATIPPGSEITVSPEYLTERFVGYQAGPGREEVGLYGSGISSPIIVRTTDGSNPHDAKSNSRVLVNPKRLTTKFEDDKGVEIQPPHSQLIGYGQRLSGNQYEVAAPEIYGYITPRKYTLDFTKPGDEVTHTFVYKKLTQEQIDKARMSDMSIETYGSGGTKSVAADGSSTANLDINIDRTGFSTGEIVNPTIRVEFSRSNIFSPGSVSLPNIVARNIRVQEDFFEFTYNGTIHPGDSIKIPATLKYNMYTTPSNEKFNFQATMVDVNGTNNAVAQSNTDYLEATYKKPYMRVYANGKYEDGVVTDYDRTIVSRDTNESRVADEGKTHINYDIRIDRLDRNVSDYTIFVPLPTYSIHPDSSVKPTLPGNQGYAVFNKDENPEWELDEKTHTLTYTGDHGGKHSAITKKLTLHYPGSKERENITLSPHADLTPHKQADKEPVMSVSDSITNYFYRWVPPQGKVFVKTASYPQHSNGTVFYDNTKERSDDFGWSLTFNAPSDLTNVVIRDTDLDHRMYYDHAVIPASFGAGTLIAYSEDGGALWQEDFTHEDSQPATVRIPESIGRKTHHIDFVAENTLPKGNSGVIRMVSKLREPNKKHFDSTHGSKSNVFSNTMEFNSDQVTGSYDAQKTIRAANQSFMATKSASHMALTDDSGVYTVGFMPSLGYGEDIHNFEQIDLLPKGLDVTGYTMNPSFAKNPGAKVEFIENYRNTGHDAVIWTADTVPYSNVDVDRNNIVGTVSVYVSLSVPTGDMVNDVFLRADEVEELNPTEDPRLPEGIWSKADVSNYVSAVEMMSQRKSIRTYDQDDNPTGWRTHADTYPSQKIDYRLRVTNGTEVDRQGLVFYDVLPATGDLGIGAVGKTLPRESEFANVFDTTREITVPEGMIAQYYNSDKEIPEYNGSTATSVLENLKWEDSPSENTKAIRVISKDGKPVKLGARQSKEVIIPMIANKSTQDGIPGIPSKETDGKIAWNSFFSADDSQERLIEGNRVSNTMVGKPMEVKFTKIGMEKKPLSGARFEYRRADDSVVTSAMSDKDGIVRFPSIMPADGDYIMEAQAPEGYVTSTEHRVITTQTLKDHYESGKDVLEMDDWFNSTPMVPIEPMVGSLEFTKVDAYGKPMSGIGFELSKKWEYNGVEYQTVRNATSTKDGKVIIHNIPAGKGYTLREVASPGHIANIKPITDISITRDQTIHVGETIGDIDHAIANDKADVPINKIGINKNRLNNEDGNPKKFGEFGAVDGNTIEGAEIKVTNTSDNKVVFEGSVGEATLRGLDIDTVYRIEETKEPEKFSRIDNFPMEFQVDSRGVILNTDGKPFDIQSALFVPNTRDDELSTVAITKDNGVGVNIPGAEFVLEKLDNKTGKWEAFGGNTSAKQVTNDGGVAQWGGINSGDYRVRETKAPTGYAITDQVFEFTATGSASREFEYKFTNYKLSPIVSKVEMIAESVSKGDADYIAAGLKDKNNVEVVSNGELYNVVRNLAGATLQLKTDPEGAVIEEITTNDKGVGYITTDVDENTTYYLVETQAPEGYVLRSTPVRFTPADYTKLEGFTGHFTVFVPNAKEAGSLVISKVSQDTGEPILSDKATFKVTSTDPDNPWEKEVSTNTNNGIGFLDEIPFGNYTLTEVDAPTGFILDGAEKSFTIDENTTTARYVITNDPAEPGIELSKKINGHDANSRASTVLINRDDDTMDVTFDFENTGNTLLEDVTLTDVVDQGGDQDKINKLLENAEITVTDNESKSAGTTNGVFENGRFSLIPGGKATLTIKVDTPEKNTLHKDTATVVGLHGKDKITDGDPAHAIKVDTAIPLPNTGSQAVILLGITVLVLTGGGMLVIRRRA